MFEYWSHFETLMVISSIFGIVVSLLPMKSTTMLMCIGGILISLAFIGFAIFTSSLDSFRFPFYVIFGPALYGIWLITNFFRTGFGRNSTQDAQQQPANHYVHQPNHYQQ
ncbi:hypothetical protein EG850_12810 [Gulosibacter macacae]|uniref:Uncharacterized protein n=1 Tax=Gulosibacter macacae TaxID=2488791 RepID=A0A3P3VT12_9MICO|nr:hypothetical protein [Gulosibacter macacae]RRJ85594.1 hypothetical protein EG850_12810 [Gulosibacter macacae]